MRLADAATYFDRLTCADAYNPATTFKAQFNLYDDSTRDGVTVERRVISTAPSVAIPARRVIIVEAQPWLVGNVAPDYFDDAAIRYRYPVQRADGLATIKTIQQTLQGAPGTSAYAGVAWVKGAKEVDESSNIFDVLNAYFSSTETLSEHMMFSLVGRWYLVRTVFGSSAGFLTAVVDELPEPVVETGSIAVRTYNPVSDSHTSTNTSLQVVRMRWQSAFEYLSPASENYERGDMQAMILKAVTPKVQDMLNLSDGAWRILAMNDEGTYWSLHLRAA
jgi:hypothetical protein